MRVKLIAAPLRTTAVFALAVCGRGVGNAYKKTGMPAGSFGYFMNFKI